MLAEAWREVRQHPGRVVATLIAIAISVAFIAGAAVFLGTEQGAIGKQGSIQYSATDVVATPDFGSDEQLSATEALQKIRAVEGVDDVDPTYVTTGLLQKDGGSPVMMTLLNVPAEGFRWSELEGGTWAQKADELTLTRQVADQLGAAVGDTIEMDGEPVTVVGISDDPTTKLNVYAYIGVEKFTQQDGNTVQGYSVNLTDGADEAAVISAISAVLPGWTVQTAADAQDAFVNDLADGIDIFRYLFAVFQFIAILVGMIIIANTFTILITQRRRQIGLLRAIGASSAQVQRKFLAEAVVLGALGSVGGILLGYLIAAAGSWWTGSLQFGISFPWMWLLIAFVIGVVVTVAASFIPIMKTTRVSPLEALQPVLNADAEKRVSRIRAVVIGIFFVIGAVLALVSFFGPADPSLYWALGSAFFLVIAVLFGAPLYIPTLLRLVGRLVSWRGPTARLAVMNSSRNPQRAAATSVALMLAMGLIVTMQVGTATIRTTMISEIEQQFPVDMSVTSISEPLSDSDAELIRTLPNINQITELRGGQTETDQMPVTVLAPDANLAKVTSTMPTTIPDDVAYVGGGYDDGTRLTLSTKDGGTLVVTTKTFNDVGFGQLLVSESTMQKVIEQPGVYGYWIKVTDRGETAGMQSELTPLLINGQVMIGGGALLAGLINQVLDILLLVVTALLAVAVTIALVGVANTLGLSVIERTRESALLRALGMKRGSLRIMLLIEAVLLAIVGTVVGLIGGSFLAWMGIRGAFRTVGIPVDELKFDINPWQTLILLGVAVLFAALASILPGRRAASASPTEALATD